MYEDYWGLTNPPFEIQPDPRFLYPSKEHGACLSALHQAVTEGRSGAMVVGEFGTGKTLLAQKLLHNLAGLQYRIAYLTNPTQTPLQMLRSILSQLAREEAPPKLGAREAAAKLQEVVLELTRSGKGAVVVLDDAHSARTKRAFDELYSILEACAHTGGQLTLIALGEDELEKKTERVPGIASHLPVRIRLAALDEEETGNLIEHRMKQAWYIGNGRVFTGDAVHEIYLYAAGNPRQTCEMANRALIAGMEKGVRLIDGIFMRSVIMEHEGREW